VEAEVESEELSFIILLGFWGNVDDGNGEMWFSCDVFLGVAMDVPSSYGKIM
jgi:hypothetical protein